MLQGPKSVPTILAPVIQIIVISVFRVSMSLQIHDKKLNMRPGFAEVLQDCVVPQYGYGTIKYWHAG